MLVAFGGMGGQSEQIREDKKSALTPDLFRLQAQSATKSRSHHGFLQISTTQQRDTDSPAPELPRECDPGNHSSDRNIN